METLKHRLNGHEDLLKRQGETLEAQTAMLDSGHENWMLYWQPWANSLRTSKLIMNCIL